MSLTLRSTNRSIGRNEAMRAAAASGFTAVIGTGFLIAAPFTQALAQPPEPKSEAVGFDLKIDHVGISVENFDVPPEKIPWGGTLAHFKDTSGKMLILLS